MAVESAASDNFASSMRQPGEPRGFSFQLCKGGGLAIIIHMKRTSFSQIWLHIKKEK
jgi:hypothetical protein